MSKIEALGAKAKDRSDWNHAWKVVARLAEAQGATLRQIDEDDRTVPIPSATPDRGPDVPSPAISAAPFAPVAPDQLTRDIAEIERAAVALRRAEPALEPRAPEPETIGEARTSRSIWPLIGVVWLTAVLVVSCAVGAIVLLVG
ncbi:MAG TPA: hypothetical protein VGI22_06135 [Xanthobacteraceae bacterium]|jgi:hypothetical protein